MDEEQGICGNSVCTRAPFQQQTLSKCSDWSNSRVLARTNLSQNTTLGWSQPLAITKAYNTMSEHTFSQISDPLEADHALNFTSPNIFK